MGLSYGKETQHGANKAFSGRAQIARAVLEIVATKGAHALTAMEIAKRVGVSDAALFRHFADKVEIIEAAVQVFEELRFESFPP